MILKYVGPKPIISHTGIEFDTNKEDKFVYINIAVQLLEALDHDYFENKTYTYDINNQRLSTDDKIKILKKYCPNLDEIMNKENHNVEHEIEHYLQRADESKILNSEEKEVLKNNIELMHDYLVQRSVNKSVYYAAIEALADLVKKDHIEYIVTPMYQKFWHVLHSIQGVLAKQKAPIDTNMEIFKKDGQLLVKLKVINILQ